MKLNTQFFASVVSLASLGTAFSQGTFQNLSFESATVPLSQAPSPPGVPTVDVGIALPGWSAFIGTNQVTMIMYNSPTLDTSAIALLRDNVSVHYPFLNVLEGSFSVFLLGGYWPSTSGSPTDVSLSQTGMLPANVRSIQFKTSSQIGVSHPIVVSVDGQVLSTVPLQVTPEYTLRGADVTVFAGQVKELRFTLFAPTDGGGGIPGILDSIVFSPDLIPEPSALRLLAFGALLLGWRLRGTRSS